MGMPSGFASALLQICAYAGWLLVLVTAVRYAPWRQLGLAQRQHVLLGSIVALLLLWTFEASVLPGLGFHFLAVTVFTLMFGWSLGVLGISVVLLATLLYTNNSDFATLGLNALLLAVLPVTLSYLIYRFVYGYLPHNVFIYIFLCAFLGAIVTATTTVLLLVGTLAWVGVYSIERMTAEYLPFLPLYLFPEGLLNGMLTTVFVALRPEWLKTFDDEEYFRN